jgi:hypothetical protein
MAGIALGIAASHSPLLSLSPDLWSRWAERDARRSDLQDEDGSIVAYDVLLARRQGELAPELTPGAFHAKAERCRTALDTLQARIAAARLDAVIVIGDDQLEHLHPDNLPPILVFHGPSIRNTRAEVAPDTKPEDRARLEGYHEPESDVDYPVAVDLAEHLIGHLLDRHFDVASSSRLPRPRAEGHALQFPHRRLLGRRLPVVPVLLNTYVSPAQPRAARCYDLGAALAEGAAAFRADGHEPRVGILASGGLSHFVVNERFDRAVLRALAEGDAEFLRALPEAMLQSGTSETKCWLAAAGACRGLGFELVDYVPAYRTAAGTGVGLGFGIWS